MAKETKTVPTPVTDKMAAVRAARASSSGSDLFVKVKEYQEDTSKRIAPQMKLIIETVQNAEKGITREALEKTLTGKMVTRQPVGRVVAYYQKPMIDLGAITVQKASAPAK